MEGREVAEIVHRYLSGGMSFTELRQWRGAHVADLALLTNGHAAAARQLARALDHAIAGWQRGWSEGHCRQHLIAAAREAAKRGLWFWDIP